MANVYLASAELAAVAALLGKLPTPQEYMSYAADLQQDSDDTYRYMNFDQINSYTQKADNVIFQASV